MIQRIQTLWMLVTTALVCFAGAMVIDNGMDVATILASPLSICVAALIGLAALVPFVAIFLYKNRRVQMRFLAAEFFLLAGAAGCTGYYVWTIHNNMAAMLEDFWLSFSPLLIVIAILTNWLALRGVKRDERLVRSVDRIR